MGTLLLSLVFALNVVLLVLVYVFYKRFASALQPDVTKDLAAQNENLENALTQRFSAATADMAMRLEQTKGDLRQQVADRLEAAGRNDRSGRFDRARAGGKYRGGHGFAAL